MQMHFGVIITVDFKDKQINNIKKKKVKCGLGIFIS